MMQVQELFTSVESRWAAIHQRLVQADGLFVYGVKTTGVYCRPGCASRQPKQANVQFFDTNAAAEQAGFRPCKRCNPQSVGLPDGHAAAIKRACDLITHAEEAPALTELAAAVGLSPSHFHRLFKTTVGITPKQYALAHRQNRVQERLQQDNSVTEAVFNAGFASNSRFYSQSEALLGMKPAQFRAGAQGQTIQFALMPCSLGWVIVAGTERGVAMIELGDTPDELLARLKMRFPQANCEKGAAAFTAWVEQVIAFIEAPGKQPLQLPLDIQGTAFQRRVWLALRDIPSGSTLSYRQIAEQIGQPKATRAVAQACGANHLAVAIPCHRVVRQNGDLGGYRWGVERKQVLLARESAAAE